MKLSLRLIGPMVVLAAACAEPPPVAKPRDEMTQRERDSTIAASRLPGSSVVKKGLSMADAEARRQAMLDSITNGY
jgi:hypothetical protein